MRLSPASYLLAMVATNPQAGAAAASSVRPGRELAADNRTPPDTLPTGHRPRASPRSKAAVAVRALEDRLGPERGLGSLDDIEASFGRELEEFACHDGADFVDCVNGEVKDSPNQQTCADACGADCCQGTLACDKFTGKVCKNKACMGTQACREAKIGLVDSSCARLDGGQDNKPCHLFGSASSATSGMRLKNSCKGVTSCEAMARFSGHVTGDIIDSCHGKRACLALAHYGTINGDIKNSCINTNNERACESLASGGAGGGFEGGIIDSCYGGYACANAFQSGTIEGALSGACQGNESCRNLARKEGSNLSRVYNCCNADAISGTSGGCYFPDYAAEAHIDDSDIPPACLGPLPTPGPTSSPTPSNFWTLEFQEMDVTLAADAEAAITFTYLIASGRDYEMSLLKKGCSVAAPVDDDLYNVTNSTTVLNTTHQLLNVSYSLDKSEIASSSIWNNKTSTIELCQVAGLLMLADNEKLVFVEVKREVEVYVDGGANFTLKTNLTGLESINKTEEVDAAGSVNAFKCTENFLPNNGKLSPNDVMYTCVGSRDDTFEVETLDSMTISQTGKPEMQVIVGDNIEIPSITSRSYTADGVIVGSRIPNNLFDFADGKFLTITGAVTMKLADGTSRRLAVDLGSFSRNLQDESNEASYTVDVALQAAEESSIQDLTSNSAAGVAAGALKGFAIAAFFLL